MEFISTNSLCLGPCISRAPTGMELVRVATLVECIHGRRGNTGGPVYRVSGVAFSSAICYTERRNRDDHHSNGWNHDVGHLQSEPCKSKLQHSHGVEYTRRSQYEYEPTFNQI